MTNLFLTIAVIAQSAPYTLPTESGVPIQSRTYSARDIAALAAADIITAPNAATSFYIWNMDGTKKAAAAVNFTVNAVMSSATGMVHPVFVGRRYDLLRYDLLQIAPRRKDFVRLWNVIAQMASVDPYFHQPGGKIAWIKTPVKRYRASNGKWYDFKYVKGNSGFQFAVGSGGAGPLQLISTLTNNNPLPIMRHDWFIASAWQTVDIDGIVGRYYELTGITGKSHDQFIEMAGGNRKIVQNLRADQRAVLIGGPTGNWRMIEAFSGIVRPEYGPSVITNTYDIADDEVDAKNHPFLNLIKFKFRAIESIAAKQNGLHRFALFNGKGVLQDEAPPDVASWPNSPHTTKRLIAGVSCIECHGGNRGYNPVKNYVLELHEKGFDPVRDLNAGKGLADAWDRLQGLYLGDLSVPLKLAGNAYASAVDRATWGAFGSSSVEGVSAEVVRVYNGYFDLIDASAILRELGYKVAKENALRRFGEIVPAVADEHGLVAMLRLGLPIKRGDLHLVFFELTLRELATKGGE